MSRKRTYEKTNALAGAEYLASIYGTESDRVNCAFYNKIGACRHGDHCSRVHHKPTFSPTIILKNLYHNPIIDVRRPDAYDMVGQHNNEEQQYFDEFYEEVFTEIQKKYGEIEEMVVCENIGEHMVGNTYVMFVREEDASAAVAALNNRWFNGMPVFAELSPVSHFAEARCRQHELTSCSKGAFCNFMHLKPISPWLGERLYGGMGRMADAAGHYPTTKRESRGSRKTGHRDSRRRSNSPSHSHSSRKYRH